MIEKSIETARTANQKLTLDSRKQLALNGVTDIEAFSDREVVLATNMGRLTVKGDSLKISKLNVDTGDFCVSGFIISLVYSKATPSGRGGMIERLFK